MAERMVERLCRVMCVGWGIDPDSTAGGTYDAGCLPKGEPAWTIWDDQVLVILKAMREPTEAMVEAGRWPAEDDGPAACWRAMIDEALSVEGVKRG